MVRLKRGPNRKKNREMINNMFQSVSIIQDIGTRNNIYSKLNQLLKLSDLYDSGQFSIKSNQYRKFQNLKYNTRNLIKNKLKIQDAGESSSSP